jgi:NAD(P)-dependent dehydrogenase (short-subunit alcohol dehydrogenase family)
MTNSMRICDRVAVVIGGASGIGRTLALGLAAHGRTPFPPDAA